jgi:hypothetical protein
MDWQEALRQSAHLFPMGKTTFPPDEVALAYVIYNAKFGTSKRDLGCGSCRRDVILAVKKLVQKL